MVDCGTHSTTSAGPVTPTLPSAWSARRAASLARPRTGRLHALGGLGESIFGKPPVANRPDNGVTHAMNRIALEVAAETERIRTRCQREDRALGDADRPADRTHLERIGHHESGKAELL